ncbi:MAG TPA: aminotransferase class III-fold pyridoxal phosphate-dependent enzyme, partial [Acetobacteraceae bacterium]|nr:aminotransferase class III-fold pyridoxal phosphate-dependent enzyme [Acetobacteraceae bacterium]
GAGLIVGLKCVPPQGEVASACLAEGLLTVNAGENVLRLVPPLIVREAECDEAAAMLRRAALRCLPTSTKVAAK